jgi:siroheme synthase-like protein
MRTHPVFLRLERRRCVVVGGDGSAGAKIRACLDAGAAEVVVVAPAPSPEIAALLADARVRHEARAYRSGDLTGAAIAYASTDDAALAARLAADAERERVLLNVVDRPEASAFLSPAVLERGELRIAIGTGGASPGLAARLRRDLERVVGPEYGPFVAILGAVRRALAVDPRRRADRRRVLAALLASPLLDLVRDGRWDDVEGLLARVAGPTCTLDRLGMSRGAVP